MMETIRSWLVGITCAAAITALAESLMPKGTPKKIGKGIGGLILMVALIQPVLAFSYEDLAAVLARYHLEAEGYSKELEQENQQLMQGVIAEQTGAYIADKAGNLGCMVSVKVECALDDTGFPYPVAVTVKGTITPEQKQELQRIIEADFSILEENQRFVVEQEAGS